MSGVNTLMSQAFGAGNYARVGHILQRAIGICTCMMLPISLLWIFGTKPILLLIGIEPVTAELAQGFARVYIFYLWPMLTVQCIQCFLRAQRIVKPITVMSVIAAPVNVGVMYFSIDTFGFIGAPLGQVASAWLLLLVYMLYFLATGIHKRCWHGLSSEGRREWGPVLKLGAGGTATMMGMWWSWEICLGLAGTLGTVPLAAHACMTNLTFFYWAFIGSVSMATSIRCGNHLGAGQPAHAKMAAKAPYYLHAVIMATIWTVLMSLRHRVGYLYTAEPAVAELAAQALPMYLSYQTCSCLNFTVSAARSVTTLLSSDASVAANRSRGRRTAAAGRWPSPASPSSRGTCSVSPSRRRRSSG